MRDEYANTINALRRMASNGKLMLTGKELVEIGIVGSEQTLRNDRWRGVGIPYHKFGKNCRYSIPDIINYITKARVETKAK